MIQPIRLLSIYLVLGILFLVAFSAGPAIAGTITGWSVTSQGNTGTAIVFYPVNTNADNDNSSTVGDNPTVAVKRFDNGTIDINFTVAPDGDPAIATQHHSVEFVDNNTGIDWTSYIFQLIPGVAGDGLDFDTPDMDPAPSSSAFSNVQHYEDMLVFSNGVHSSGAELYTVRIDVPDCQ